MDRLKTEKDDAQTRLRALNREILTAWRDYISTVPESAQISYNQFLVDYGYSADRANFEREVQIAEGAYLIEVNRAGGHLAEIGRAQADLGSPNARFSLPSARELVGKDPNTWESYYRTFVEGDIERFKAETVTQTFRVREGESHTTNFESRWGAGASVSYGWFSFGGSASGTNIQRDSEEQTTEINITFKNLGIFRITRGAWYKAGLVQEYLEEIESSFWGPSGRLNLVPQSLVLAHGVKLSIKTSDVVRNYVYQNREIAARGGFRIGPFGFGGSGGSSTTSENTHVRDTGTELEIEDTSGRAMVVAVISLRPSDFLPGGPPLSLRHMVPDLLTEEGKPPVDEETIIKTLNDHHALLPIEAR